MKMTKAQEKLLNMIKNDYELYQSMMDKDGGIAMDGVSLCWWVENFKKGIIEIQADTKTVDCLERLGYIEIVERFERKFGKDGKIVANYELVRLLNR